MYYVYVLFSSKLNKYYVGSTQGIDRRLAEHNRGKTSFSKGGKPWVIVKTYQLESRSEAMKLENQIKKRGIQRYLEDQKED